MESQMRLGEDAFLASVSPAALLPREEKLTLVTFCWFLFFGSCAPRAHCLLDYFGRGESSRSFDSAAEISLTAQQGGVARSRTQRAYPRHALREWRTFCYKRHDRRTPKCVCFPQHCVPQSL